MAFKKKSILFALLLGLKADLAVEDVKILRITGTSHLLAISGLHIGLITSFIFILSAFIGKKLSTKKFLEKITIVKFSAIISILIATSYVIISGFNVSAIRALVMILGYLGCTIFKIFSLRENFYYLSLLLILFLDPFNSLTISFWLSFLAVGLLLYSHNSIIEANYSISSWKNFILSRLSNLLTTNWVMFIGLIPVNILFFNKIYIISYLANFIAIPWMNILVLPWMFLGLVFSLFNLTISKYCIIFADLNVTWLLQILKCLAKLNSNILLEVAKINFSSFCLVILGSLWLLLPKGLINRYLGLICFMPMLLFPYKKLITHGAAIVTILDLGQGLGVVIQLAKHIMLYDVGPNNSVMINYLNSLRVRSIEQIIISHLDYDHVGSLEEVIKKYKVEHLFTNLDGYKVLNLSAKSCAHDHVWELDGVNFKFFNPNLKPLELKTNSSKHRNENSCILKMSGNGYSMLYTGDLSAAIEHKLINKYANNLQADVLLIPHHGSSGSSSDKFIDMVSPRYAVVSAGPSNRYQHPKTEILARYFARNIAVLNTIKHGSIEIQFQVTNNGIVNVNNIKFDLYRKTHKNFWNY